MKQMKKIFALAVVFFAAVSFAQAAGYNLIYGSGVYGQSFGLYESDWDETYLALVLRDNKTKQVNTYDDELPTVYFITSSLIRSAKEYSNAVKACKNFIDSTLNYVSLAFLKDICDIAPCCERVDYRIEKDNQQEYILVKYNCSDFDLLREIAEYYNRKGRAATMRAYAK